MKKAFCVFILIVTVLPTLLFILSFFTGYDIHENVSYGESSQNAMDIYMPSAEAGEAKGAVLFIHGGSWMGGDKKEEAVRCRILASRGYIAATMNYTLRSEENAEGYTVFSVMDEISAALGALKDFAATRGVAVEKAGISGYSAGAHLSLLYAYSCAESAPLKIAFVSSMAGPADISPKSWGEDMTKRIGTLLTGITLTDEMIDSGEANGILASISPTSYVTENAPPTALIHGARDTTVPIANAEALTEALEENGVPFDLVYLRRSDHSLLQNPLKHLSYYKLLVGYADKYLN